MTLDLRHCEGCMLNGVSTPSDIMGNPNARFMVVTDTPNKFNAAKGRLLSEKPVAVFSTAMQDQGFSKKDFLFVPQIRCPHDTEQLTTKELRDIQKHCREHLLDDIGEYQPECIVPLGAEPSRQVMGRAVKITKIRGVGEYVEEHKCTVLPLLNPGQVVMYPQHQPIFNADVATLRRLVDAKYDVSDASESLLGDYEYIDDLEFLIEQKPKIVFFDTENTSLEFFKKGTHNVRDYDPKVHGKEFNPDAAILTMQFCIKPGKAYMLVWDHPDAPMPLRRKRKMVEQLRRLLCAHGTRVMGQNIKYDNNYLFEQTGIRFKIGGDTLMLAALLDENMISKSQDTLVKHYVPDMAGYADCVHPDTVLLLEDLTKKRAADIQPNDRLIGFEEFAVDGDSRKMVPTEVVSVRKLKMASYRLTMEGGQKIQVSTNHQFLKEPRNPDSGGNWVWRSAGQLMVGDRLKLFPTPEEGQSFDDGWMCGILDGEGTQGRITGIEYVGTDDVVSIETTSHTFIANGFATHNCFNATTDKSRMWEVPLTKLLGYGCGDADSGLRLYHALWKVLKEDPRLVEHYQRVSLPALNVFAAVEAEGIQIDDDALVAFQAIMEESVGTQYAELIEQVPKSIKRAHIDKGLKFTRSDFVRDILFRHKDGFRLRPQVFTAKTAKLPANKRIPSTSSKDHLPYFYDECPFTMLLSQYVKDERLLNTSIKGFKAKYIHDGMVRPIYSLWTTVTGRSSCVKGDTPIDTMRGKVRADEIQVGDFVWTHKGRWRQVQELFEKPVTEMFALSLSNGEVLTVTGQHRLLLITGEWATVESLITSGDSHALSQQSTHEGQSALSQGGRDVPYAVVDSAGGGRRTRSQPLDRTAYDSQTHTGGDVSEAEGHALPSKQAGREKPAVWPRVGYRLCGRVRVPDATCEGGEVPRASDSICGGVRATPLTTSEDDGGTSCRREPAEQFDRQPSAIVGRSTPENTREVPTTCGGFAIEKVDRAGMHRVYDFQVEEDHSYLACGVFNHNSENPNGQNFPKRGANATAYRRMFVAPPGYYVLEADLSQAELRIAADMANDRTMLKIYADAGDIHTTTALIVMSIPIDEFRELPKAEQKIARQKAKAVNFGFIYGMGWRKFIGYAKTQYNAIFTEEEAQRVRTAFFNKYSALPSWHEAMREFAHRNGMVRSYSGRIRHLPMIASDDEGVQAEAGRQAINSPVQEFASSLGLMAMGRMHEEIDSKYLAPIAFVHDAIYCYVPMQYAEWGAKTLKWYMESNPVEEWFGRKMKCPIVADVSLGMNFGDTHELEGLKLDTPYDFGKLYDEETGTGLRVIKQRTPPKGGRLETLPYSTP